MKKILTEVAVYSPDAAVAAQQAGADRVELCYDLQAGGVTPSSGAIETARKLLHISLHVIIRPRGGNFLYNETEITQMKADIMRCKETGVDGVVFGLLNSDSNIDTMRCSELAELAKPMVCTFHRAFDMTTDPLQAMENIISCGFSRILTSGCSPSAIEGAQLLSILVSEAHDRIIIMPGGKVRKENIEELIKITKAYEYHTSATLLSRNEVNRMNYIIHPGTGGYYDEFSNYSLDSDELKKFINTVKKIKQ